MNKQQVSELKQEVLTRLNNENLNADRFTVEDFDNEAGVEVNLGNNSLSWEVLSDLLQILDRFKCEMSIYYHHGLMIEIASRENDGMLET